MKTDDKNNNFKARFLQFFKKIGEFFDKIMFPEDIKCIFCGRDISNFDEKFWCDDCEKEITLNNKNRCLICAEPIDNEATVCDFCQKNKRYFKRAFCPFVYDGKIRSSILSYKDSNQRYKAKPFARAIAHEILASGVKIDTITFIPLTAKKKKKRSFDQAELLATELGKILKIPVVCLFEKVREGKMQKQSTYKERQTNIKGMYVLKDVKLSKSQSILIVDDIITTCASVNYCSSLIANKVQNVYVASIARNKLKFTEETEKTSS